MSRMPEKKKTFHYRVCGIFFNIFAGVPPATVKAGISFITTEFVATIEFSPIVTPGNITTFKAIQAPLLIVTGLTICDSGPRISLNGKVGLLCVKILTPPARET